MYASYYGHIDVVRLLLDGGANIQARTNVSGVSVTIIIVVGVLNFAKLACAQYIIAKVSNRCINCFLCDGPAVLAFLTCTDFVFVFYLKSMLSLE